MPALYGEYFNIMQTTLAETLRLQPCTAGVRGLLLTYGYC